MCSLFEQGSNNEHGPKVNEHTTQITNFVIRLPYCNSTLLLLLLLFLAWLTSKPLNVAFR